MVVDEGRGRKGVELWERKTGSQDGVYGTKKERGSGEGGGEEEGSSCGQLKYMISETSLLEQTERRATHGQSQEHQSSC